MIEIITSSSNKNIKAIKALADKKYRDVSGLFIAEGVRLVTQALQSGVNVEYMVFCPDLLRSETGKNSLIEAQNRNIRILQVTREIFEKVSSREGPQGLLAVVQKLWKPFNAIQPLTGLWVALDAIQDSGNLGSVMRTLDAFGGKGIILIGNCTDPFQVNTARASMGAIFSLQIYRTTPDGFLNWSKSNKIPIIGTWIGDSKNYRFFKYPENLILLMGSEQKGLQKELLDICTDRVMIPMNGTVDSLNLSCAASIILAEIYSQHKEQYD